MTFKYSTPLAHLFSQNSNWKHHYQAWSRQAKDTDRDVHRYNNAIWLSLLENGDTTSDYYGACHVRLKNSTASPVHAIISKVRRKSTPKHPCPNAFSYISWLINSSPWSGVFLNSSVKSVFDEGAIARTDVPSNLMMQGLQCTRYIWDRPYRIEHWKYLVNNGVHPLLAFLMGHYHQWHYADKKRIEWSGANYEHDLFHWEDITYQLYHRLLNGETVDENDSYHSNHDYVGTWKLWGRAMDDDDVMVSREEWEDGPTSTFYRESDWSGERIECRGATHTQVKGWMLEKAIKIQEEYNSMYRG